MDLQYFHGQFSRVKHTIVVDVPPKESFEDLILGKIKEIRIPIGSTECHPKDQYVKKIGRQYALSRCQSEKFTLNQVRHLNNKILITLSSSSICHLDDYLNPAIGMNILFEYKHDRKRVFFLG